MQLSNLEKIDFFFSHVVFNLTMECTPCTINVMDNGDHGIIRNYNRNFHLLMSENSSQKVTYLSL